MVRGNPGTDRDIRADLEDEVVLGRRSVAENSMALREMPEAACVSSSTPTVMKSDKSCACLVQHAKCAVSSTDDVGGRLDDCVQHRVQVQVGADHQHAVEQPSQLRGSRLVVHPRILRGDRSAKLTLTRRYGRIRCNDIEDLPRRRPRSCSAWGARVVRGRVGPRSCRRSGRPSRKH